MSKSEISVPLMIQNIVCSMQLDTGCALVFSTNMSFLKTVCPYVELKPTALSNHTGETMRL